MGLRPRLYVFWLSLLPVALFAQQRVTERFQEQPLAQVFEVFEQKYGLSIAYDAAAISPHTLTLQLDGEPVVQALYRVLDASGMEYRTLAEDKILVRPKPAPAIPVPATSLLTGIIRDAETQAPLPFASIHWVGQTVGDCTNADGLFSLSLPDLDTVIQLELRYIGYESRRVAYTPGQPLSDLSLRQAEVRIPEVVVVEMTPALSANGRDQFYTIRPGAQLPGLGSQLDPLHQLQLLPGVGAHNDFSSGLQVRGGMPDENLIVWDGMILYDIDHFFGIFSSVDGNLLESVRLYKNSFPAEYGGRTASIVEMLSPEGLPEKTTGSATVSNLLLQGNVSVPLGKRMSLTGGGRITHSNLGTSSLFQVFSQQLDLPGMDNESLLTDRLIRVQPAFQFHDAFLKWRWQLSEKTTLEANAFSSSDTYDYEYGFDFRQRLRDEFIISQSLVTENSNWQNQAWSTNLQHEWNDKWQSALTIGGSRYEETERTTTSFRRVLQDTVRAFGTDNLRYNDLDGLHLNWKNTWTPKSGTTYTLGYRLEHNATALNLENDEVPIRSRISSGTQYALYAGGEYESGPWDWSWATHLTYYSRTQRPYVSPRLRARYRWSDRWSVNASLSRYHQFLRRYYHENRFGRSVAVWELANEAAVPVAHANQAAAGLQYTGAVISWEVGGFFKRTEGSLQHAALISGLGTVGDPRPRTREFRLFSGEGRNYGAEVLIRKTGDRYTSWLSYTLSRSLQRYPAAFQNEWFPTQEDRPHQLSWYNEYRFDRWAWSATYVYASGAPFLDTSLDDFRDERGQGAPDYYQRIAAYHRLDLSAAYTIPLKGSELTFGASVYNLADAPNTLYRQQFYGIDLPAPNLPNRTAVLGNELQLLGRTWSVWGRWAW
ncbi:MAG: TonB-dependent receptor [Phaeodactylibacter sp.]|uniref:TonB-dependent receptor n=1 Tax=Phaeodactylibacter sp. TaxID=1940289 RepID=UPI0032F09A67